MPRAQQVSVLNNLSRGYLTQATALTFPENACTDVNNCIFDITGFAERRPGFNFEVGFVPYSMTYAGGVVKSYLWQNVSGEGDTSFVVVQVGNSLHFYRVASNQALSANKHSTVINLLTYATSGITTVASIECGFSSGNGALFVTNQHLESFFVTYDLNSDTFTATAINIQVRDFLGDTTDPSATTDTRPTSTVAGLDNHHHYNLLNQGWTAATLAAWDTARTDMPSNADVSWYFKSPTDTFDFTLVDQRAVGNALAPRGHFIYTAYNINRSANQTGATDETIPTERVTNSAFFAGRVFYAGMKVTGSDAKIFFSQIIQTKAQYGLCYEANDPTSEMLFALLPTDGGIIQIVDSGIVHRMIPALNALLIFCSNGVWSLSGSQGIGFTANDYTLSKVSAVRTLSTSNFINVEGIPYWWNLDGIYTVTLDAQTNAIKVISITDTTIKSFFNGIPGNSKLMARGSYDFFTKRLVWIYRTAPIISFEDNYVYDSILTFSLITNAFSKWSLNPTLVQLHSIVDVIGAGGTFEETPLFDSANTVIDGTDAITAFVANNDTVDSTMKYFVSYGLWSGFAECFDERNVDWYGYDSIGQTYDSYFITGYSIKGQAMTKFQTNYVNVFCDNSVNSSFIITGLWDFAGDSSSNKWSIPQTLTVTADSFTTKNKRVKIRGNGLACQIKIENNGNDPFAILGWSIFESGAKWP